MFVLNDIKISKKLPAIIVCCAIVASSLVGGLSYMQSKEAITHVENEKLEALRDTRHKELNNFFT